MKFSFDSDAPWHSDRSIRLRNSLKWRVFRARISNASHFEHLIKRVVPFSLAVEMANLKAWRSAQDTTLEAIINDLCKLCPKDVLPNIDELKR